VRFHPGMKSLLPPLSFGLWYASIYTALQKIY